MTMLASSPADRRLARASHENGADTAQPREIKYRQDAANYVAAMLAELRQIAGKAGFDKLVASLDAAYYDAYGALEAKAREAAPEPAASAAETTQEKTLAPMEPNRA